MVKTATLAARDWLQRHYFIHWDDKDRLWSPTDLGLACASAGMDPEQALALKQARLLAHHGVLTSTSRDFLEGSLI